MANVFAEGLLLICAAALLNVLAMSLNFWEKKELYITERSVNNVYSKYNTYKLRVEYRWGLWKVCAKVGDRNEYQCQDYKLNTDTSGGIKMLLVRATLFLAVCTSVGSLTCLFLKLFILNGKQQLINISWILALTAGLMSLCAFAIYTSQKTSGSDYMIAFYLAIVAWIAAWAAGWSLFAAPAPAPDYCDMTVNQCLLHWM